MHYMQLCRTDHSSPGFLSSGIMLVSTGLLWSEIGSTTITISHLPPYSLFLNAIEEFFSVWRWKVYDRQPHARMRHAETLRWDQSKGGFSTQGDIFLDA